MPLRPFLWFTASTLLGCLFLILFLDQPLAWFSHRYLTSATSFFLACTTLSEEAYFTVLMWPIKGIPLLFIGSLVGFLLVRVGLRQQWGSVLRWSGEVGENWVLTSPTHGKSPSRKTAAL